MSDVSKWEKDRQRLQQSLKDEIQAVIDHMAGACAIEFEAGDYVVSIRRKDLDTPQLLNEDSPL